MYKTTESEIWEEFELRFKQVHGEVYSRLLEKFPNLTPSEQKLCAFLRLNMTTKEISGLTGQSISTLEIGTMSDPTDPSTFELLNIVDIDSMDWTTYGLETNLSGVTGTTHIAFNVSASSPSYTSIWLDNVLIILNNGASGNMSC